MLEGVSSWLPSHFPHWSNRTMTRKPSSPPASGLQRGRTPMCKKPPGVVITTLPTKKTTPISSVAKYLTFYIPERNSPQKKQGTKAIREIFLSHYFSSTQPQQVPKVVYCYHSDQSKEVPTPAPRFCTHHYTITGDMLVDSDFGKSDSSNSSGNIP